MPRRACYRLAFRTPQHDGLHAFAIELFNPLVPLMPNLELPVIMLLARNVLSQLNVPPRQSYTMAVVDLDERGASAGILSVARTAGAAAAPLFTGAVLRLRP